MWKALSRITTLNDIMYGSTRNFTPLELEEALRFLRGEASTIDGNWSQVARNAAFTLGNTMVRRNGELEEAYQHVIELVIALEARSGKAVPVKLRGIIGTLERIATTLRELDRLTKDQSIDNMDETMGRLLTLRMRWRQLLEFTGIEQVNWIKGLLMEARVKVIDKVQTGQLSSRFETLVNRVIATFGIEVANPVVPDENIPPKRIKFGEGVRVEWDDDL
jgi:hypothetical protein